MKSELLKHLKEINEIQKNYLYDDNYKKMRKRLKKLIKHVKKGETEKYLKSKEIDELDE